MHIDCKQCGACCRQVVVKIAEPSQDELRWLKMRGKVRDNQWRLPAVCKHLDDNKCRIYGDRPAVCREYEAGGECCQKARECDER